MMLQNLELTKTTLTFTHTALINAYSTRNLGDAAILRSIIGLVPGGRADAVIAEAEPLPIPGLTLVRSHRAPGPRISVGGDIFNNARPWFVTRNFALNIAKLREHPNRTISFGQTIPESCRGIALKWLVLALKALPAVITRDFESYSLLRQHGVQAQLSWDVAFVTKTDTAANARARMLYEEQGLEPERTAVISVRPFDRMYPHDQIRMQSQLLTLATTLLNRGHQVALLLQSDVSTADSDRLVLEEIRRVAPRLAVLDFMAKREDTDPVATFTSALGMAHIAVAVRYHTSILRLASGRQPYNLYYSRKGVDLQNRLNLSGTSLSHFDAETAIKAIEATAEKPFDAGFIQRDISDRFASALRLIA
ncbi:MAG: polysaccharide pyruvyl transferase family protein [Hyphomicrobiaceae bacterium]